MIFILFLIYCTPLGTGFEIKSIFCSISESCECDYKPDIKGKVCMILTAVSSAYKQLALACVVLSYSVELPASAEETRGFISK